MNDSKRIQLLGVPVDNLSDEELGETIRQLATDGGKHQIVFLNLRGLLKARGKSEYAQMVQQASLVIPTASSIAKGARFLGLQAPQRHNPFGFTIKLLGAVEQIRGSLYMVGSKPGALHIASSNVRDSFPGLRLVGRYAGYFRQEIENDVILAIRKAGPTVLLAGDGLKGKGIWLKRNEKAFGFGISMYSESCFKIFSGKKRRTPNKSWDNNTWWLAKSLTRPWRWFAFLKYIRYGILLLIDKIKRHYRS